MISKPKVVFLLAGLSQPRYVKRIRGFIEAGYDIEIYGFARKRKYNIDSNIENYEVVNLGYAPSGSGYLKKILDTKRKLSTIFKRHEKTDVLYYGFSFNIALICKIYRRKYIYEISDLVYGYFPSKIIRSTFSKIDRIIIRNSILTVMTSKGFYEFLYPNKMLKNVIIQPNKVDSSFKNFERTIKPISVENLSFSYVGAFRYPNTVFRFARIIGERYPQHSFLFFGDSELTEKVKELAAKYKNIKYLGPFKNPNDLPEIYSQINIVIACYDTKTLNERIAEPNKLYESLFFNKPIIVSKNTFLEKQVLEKYNCGYAFDATEDKNIITYIDSLKTKTLEKLVDRIKSIHISEIVDDKSSKIIDFVNTKYK